MTDKANNKQRSSGGKTKSRAGRKERIKRRNRLVKSRMNRHNLYLLVIIPVIILILDIAGIIKPDVSFSEYENRQMQAVPEPSKITLLNGELAGDIDSYVSDQFFGRERLVSVKTALDRTLFKSESGGVYMGKDGYLCEVPKEPDPVWFDKNLDAINTFAGKHSSLNIYMSVVPNSAYILTEYMPKNLPVRDQSKDTAAIMDRLPKSVKYLDVTETMRAHQNEGIYYRTDHHWTSLGAKYAFEAMAADMGISDFASEYTVYTVADDFMGTMASKSGFYGSSDQVQLYIPSSKKNDYMVTYTDSGTETGSMYVSEALEDKDKYTVFFGGNHPMIDIKTVNDNKKCLLVIKDSYANCFMQFLTPHYEHIIMVDPRYYYDDLEQLLSSQNVTDVLFLYNMNTYLEDRSLADTLVSE